MQVACLHLIIWGGFKTENISCPGESFSRLLDCSTYQDFQRMQQMQIKLIHHQGVCFPEKEGHVNWWFLSACHV